MSRRLLEWTLRALTCGIATVVALGGAGVPRAVAASWSVQPFTVPIVNAEANFEAVSCASSTTCMAVGLNVTAGKTFAESWNGTRWSITPAPNPSSRYNELLGVSCGSPSSCVAVGWDYNGQSEPVALATTWNGSSWGRPASIPTPAGTQSSTLTAVSCTSATSCMAVGTYTDSVGAIYPLAELWNGSAWTFIATPTAGQQGGRLNAISCSSASACMALGRTSSQTLVETWDGSSWTIVGAPTSANLTAVSCPAANACTAVGDDANPNNALPLAAEWNGSSWTTSTLPNPSPSYGSSLSGVSCASTSSCLAVGNYTSGPSTNQMIAEVFNGSTWSVQTLARPKGASDGRVEAVSCSTASLCTAVGVYTNWLGVYLPLVQVYNGSSWSLGQAANPTQVSPSVSLNGVSCLTASSCTIVGGYANGGPGGTPLVELWNGSGWTIQPTPNPGQQHGSTLMSIWCGSATSCVAVGDYWNTYNFPQVFGIVWNGTRWTPLQVPAPPTTRNGFESVSCASMSACAAVGWEESNTTAYNVPLAETWNGTSWTIDSVPVPSGLGDAILTGVSCSSATACTAVGYYHDSSGLLQILTEAWNGASWSVQSAPSPSGARNPSLAGVSCTSPTACTAVGGYGTSGAGQTLGEVWDGTSWSIQSTPNVGTLGTGLSGVSCTQATSCEAVGSYETSSTPTDAPVAEAWDGTSWSAQSIPVPTGAITSQLSQVSCGTATTCMATGAYDAAHTATVSPLLERYS